MRVLFVFPDLAADVTNYTGVLSPAIALLGGMLRDHGHAVSLYHMFEEPTEAEFRRRVRECDPELVCFSINTHYRRRIASWSRFAHEETGAPVVVGGIHATLAPEELSAHECIHYVCVGEGEEALLELCDALQNGRDTTRIRNFWVSDGGRVICNEARPLLRDLDALPDPDYGLFEFETLYTVRQGIFPFLMSRGCAFKCTYCSIPALVEQSGERESTFWRFLSPERAVEQLRALLDEHMPDAKKVHFLDAIMFSNRKWLKEFAALYIEHVNLPFSANLRADYITPATAQTLQDMGCEIVRFGVESGDQDISNRVLLRGLDIERIRNAFRVLREHGIQRLAYNLVGLPEENLRLSLKTARLNAELQPDITIAFIYYPYPGTALFDKCQREGYLTDIEYDNYFIGVTTELPNFSASDILFMHRYFHDIIRAFRIGSWLPDPWRRWWGDGIEAVIASPLMPRAALVATRISYKQLRHRVGEFLLDRAPWLYRVLGGTAPA